MHESLSTILPFQLSLSLYGISNIFPGDLFKITVAEHGATTIATTDDDATAGHLTLSPDGQVKLSGTPDNSALTCLGAVQFANTFDASNTEIYFIGRGNKQYLEMTGNIGNIILQFPSVSCNCVLVLKQDGTGSRLVTGAWKVEASDGNTAVPTDSGPAEVRWAGVTVPTLTTTANYVDILSFYWDATNEICYGVASQNFAGA